MSDQMRNQSSSWIDVIRRMFMPKPETVMSQVSSQINSESLRVGETYEMWGTRICGIVSGSNNALSPYLQKVYNNIYNEQAQNVALQEQAKVNIQADIDRTNQLIHLANQKKDAANAKIESLNNRSNELKEEKQNIKASKETINKGQRMKLIIGLIILFPLTIYLFLFYSSTFYSAFFRDAASITDVMNTMFDANALKNAYNVGLGEFGFVLSAPIIFMGLGFSLHFYSVQDGNMKYVKMVLILLVTLMFDCILAYKIGEQMHTLGIMIGTYPIGEVYTVQMAFRDINTWAVIFCGFIVYVIWGIVFDLCMSAYDKLDLNKTLLDAIKNELLECEKRIETENATIQDLNRQIIDYENTQNILMAKLGHQVFVDYAVIRTEMNNFFSGWIKEMKILSLSQAEMDQATTIFNNQMATLIPKQ